MAAEGSGRGRGRQEPPEPAEEAEKGKAKRKILKRERVIVLPDDVDVSALASGDGAKKLAEALGMKSGKVPTASIGASAWIVVAENEEDSQDAAITAHAGEAGTPDAKPGIWRAVPVRGGWGEATLYERPPEPKVEASKVKVD